ncbi:ADP-ribosylation family protein [Micromonospora pisi]|nr:ADP-ribosylation family protein [Micromonospora pisi]
MVSPFGLTEYFGEDGLQLVGRDGLDERLNGRFRRDPAEFVTVLMGGSDGLHYGLWYDDPAELPSFVVHNYARDSAETWTNRSPTLLEEFRWNVRAVLSDYGDTSEEAELLRPLTAALDWFATADREALESDGERRWATVARPSGGISIFPALPPRSGEARLTKSYDRISGFQTGTPQAAAWIAQAERELAGGEPAFALALGGELHWVDRDEYRSQSRDLLAGAYRALGRDALAEIVEVHAAHRDLRSVNVLVAPDQL